MASSQIRSDQRFDPRYIPVRDAGAPLQAFGGRGLYHVLLDLTAPAEQRRAEEESAAPAIPLLPLPRLRRVR